MLCRRLVAILPVSFHTLGVSTEAAGVAQVKSPMTSKPTIINDEDLIRFILMTSFRGFV
jgi:hypothetical protein